VKTKSANGQGTIYQGKTKSGKTVWYVEVTIGYRPNGTRIRTRKTCHSYKEARETLNRMVAQKQDGLLTVISGNTIHTFGEEWVKAKEGRIRPTTASDYLSRLYTYIVPYLGSVRIVDLNPRQVQIWMGKLREQGMSPRTINGARQVLLAMCKHAMRQGIIHRNPVELVDPYSQSSTKKTQVRDPWTREEIFSVIDACWDHDFLECYLHLMLHTGMRPGEALGMRWEDIDFENAELHVTGTLKEHRIVGPDGRGFVRLERNEPKTKASRRILPISEALKILP
jgi:integrase